MKIIYLLIFIPGLVFATDRGDDIKVTNSSGDSVLNNSVSDSSSAIGVGGSDYDIGRGSCRYHVGGLTFAWTRDDAFCEGISLIQAGYEVAGIRHICNQSKIEDNYSSFEECQNEMIRIQPAIPEPVIEEHFDEEEEFHEEQQVLYADLLAKIENLEEAAAKPAPRPVQRTVVEQHGLTDEQKAALREVVK
jgi:hypothetical protein